MILCLYILLASILTYSALKLLGSSLNKHNIEGDLFVSGKGKIGISLPYHRRPRHIFVNFSGDATSHPCHPCNPHHDKIHWDLLCECGEYQLEIHYNIGNIRSVEYKIIY